MREIVEWNVTERLGEFGDGVLKERMVSRVDMRNGDVVIELWKVEQQREMRREMMIEWIRVKRDKGFGEDAVIVMMMVTRSA